MSKLSIRRLLLASLAMPAVVMAAESVPATNAPPEVPRIAFAVTTFDFGKMKQGETAKHNFIFTNAGSAVLEITEVKPGCGCTTAGTWDKRVEPGKTGVIPLQFNSSGFGGKISKSAVVTSNDPKQPTTILHISGDVWRPIDVSPSMAMFQVEEDSPTNQTRVVKISSNLDEPVQLSEPVYPTNFFRAELKEVKAGKEFELSITVLPPLTGSTASASISMKTSSTNAPLVSVTAYATVQKPIMFNPQQLVLQPAPLKSTNIQAVTVYARGNNRIRVTEASTGVPGVQVTVKEPITNRMFTVQASFPAGFTLPAGEKPALTIKTDHPKHPVITIPILQAAGSPTAIRLPPQKTALTSPAKN